MTRSTLVFSTLFVLLMFGFSAFLWKAPQGGDELAAAVAGSPADMVISDPVRDASTGKVKITITLGKATVDSIKISQGIAKTANNIAQATDLADIAEIAAKGYAGKYKKIGDAVKDFVSSKLSPPQIAQAVLQFTTGTVADAVDQNCLTQAVKAAKRDSKGAVTVTRSTNFFTEKSNVYKGWYLYSQNSWSPGNCTERKVCLRFLRESGTDTGCWL